MDKELDEIDLINLEIAEAANREAEKPSAFLLCDEDFIDSPKEDMKTYKLSSSLIKEFVKNGNEIPFCPKKVYHLRIKQDYKIEPSVAMLCGLYFESGVLGETRDGTAVTDLPRKKNGEKTIDHIRIDKQILVARKVFEEHGIVICKEGENKNVQLELEKPYKIIGGINVILVIHTDIISSIAFQRTIDEKAEPKLSVIDLKLTGDRHSTWGEFCWGSPQFMDHIQPLIYNFVTSLPFVYIVFDYKKEDTMGYDFIPVNITQDKVNIMDESIRKVVGIMSIEEEYNWERTNNLNSLCQNCPIKDCKSRLLIKEV